MLYSDVVDCTFNIDSIFQVIVGLQRNVFNNIRGTHLVAASVFRDCGIFRQCIF